MYSPTVSLIDPPADSPIADGVGWVQGVAFGSIATTLAVIAVAAIGLAMLAGRLELRRGITVVLGCFILFGAASITAAFTRLVIVNPLSPSQPNLHFKAKLHESMTPDPPPEPYDPYAGASVPAPR